MSEARRDPSTAVRTAQEGNSNTILLVVMFFVLLVALGTWAAYTYGDGHIIIDGRTIDELKPWEVAGGIAIGILGAIFGLTMGVVGLLIGLAAAVVSIVLAVAGVAAGLFIAAGTLLGPFLLLAAIILLLRKSKREDEIAAKSSLPGTSDSEASMAKYWT